MKVTKNSNNYNTNFNGINNNGVDTAEKQDKMEILMRRLCEVLSKRTENEVPENGKFSPISVSFSIPQTNNKAKAIVEYDALAPKNLRRLSIASHHANSDRLISTYILRGTKQEIIDYLNNPQNQKKLIKLAGELSDSVNEYYSNL